MQILHSPANREIHPSPPPPPISQLSPGLEMWRVISNIKAADIEEGGEFMASRTLGFIWRLVIDFLKYALPK